MNVTSPEADRTDLSIDEDRHDRLPESRIRDPIQEYITATPYMLAFIDTPQFQRLRNLKQLGTSYFVWPGASHNRFEHCLGVANLARLQVEHLRKYQPSLEITERDVRCVTLAGLLHDLGHGPFSHVWDGQFIPRALPDSNWKHEEGSEMMIDYLVKNNEIDIPQDEVDFIKDIVRGEPNHTIGRDPPEKPFLFEIVANKRTGIDVDRFEYIARDSNAISDKRNSAPIRLIGSARVISGQICYNIKDWTCVYMMFVSRWELFKQIYNHNAAKAIEMMVVDALLAAEPVLDIASRIYDPARYTYLSDDILLEIERSTDKRLAEARHIVRRIRKRELYRLLDYNVLQWDMLEKAKELVTPESIAHAARELADPALNVTEGCEGLSAANIIVDVSCIHFGKGNANPMEHVKFYHKRNPNECSHASSDAGSHLTPPQYGEVLLRLYVRSAVHLGLTQDGYRKVFRKLSTLGEEMPATPTATEAPSTPRMKSVSLSDSRNTSQSTLEAKTPYSDNNFTKVPRDFVLASPIWSAKKRNRRIDDGGEANIDDTPVKKIKRS